MSLRVVSLLSALLLGACGSESGHSRIARH